MILGKIIAQLIWDATDKELKVKIQVVSVFFVSWFVDLVNPWIYKQGNNK